MVLGLGQCGDTVGTRTVSDQDGLKTVGRCGDRDSTVWGRCGDQDSVGTRTVWGRDDVGTVWGPGQCGDGTMWGRCGDQDSVGTVWGRTVWGRCGDQDSVGTVWGPGQCGDGVGMVSDQDGSRLPDQPLPGKRAASRRQHLTSRRPCGTSSRMTDDLQADGNS
ncbi:unnamed protein product [Arctogadus glacialis]